MAALSRVLAEWGARATSAPAGVLATISGTVSTLPRLLVGDAVAAFHIAGDAFSQWNHTGQPLCVSHLWAPPTACQTCLSAVIAGGQSKLLLCRVCRKHLSLTRKCWSRALQPQVIL